VFAAGPTDHALDRIPVNNGTLNAAFNGSPAQIPEPGTLALIATGLAGLAISRRRRKR